MSKRKDETAAEYSERMAAYQKAKRQGVKPASAVKPKPRVLQLGAHRRGPTPYSRLTFPEARRTKITLPITRLLERDEPPKSKCFGDLRREAMEAAGLVGFPQPVPQSANDERREASADVFKEMVQPIIAKLRAGATVTAADILDGLDLPDDVTPARAAMLVVGLLKTAGAVHTTRSTGPHYWRMPLTIKRRRAA